MANPMQKRNKIKRPITGCSEFFFFFFSEYGQSLATKENPKTISYTKQNDCFLTFETPMKLVLNYTINQENAYKNTKSDKKLNPSV